jgi:hypothetical protein
VPTWNRPPPSLSPRHRKRCRRTCWHAPPHNSHRLSRRRQSQPHAQRLPRRRARVGLSCGRRARPPGRSQRALVAAIIVPSAFIVGEHLIGLDGDDERTTGHRDINEGPAQKPPCEDGSSERQKSATPPNAPPANAIDDRANPQPPSKEKDACEQPPIDQNGGRQRAPAAELRGRVGLGACDPRDGRHSGRPGRRIFMALPHWRLGRTPLNDRARPTSVGLIFRNVCPPGTLMLLHCTTSARRPGTYAITLSV